MFIKLNTTMFHIALAQCTTIMNDTIDYYNGILDARDEALVKAVAEVHKKYEPLLSNASGAIYSSLEYANHWKLVTKRYNYAKDIVNTYLERVKEDEQRTCYSVRRYVSRLPIRNRKTIQVDTIARLMEDLQSGAPLQEKYTLVTSGLVTSGPGSQHTIMVEEGMDGLLTLHTITSGLNQITRECLGRLLNDLVEWYNA